MEKFTKHTGIAAPLRRSNVDTDQIIPAVYMRRLSKTGFSDVVFENWRTNEPDFILNQPDYKDASILVAGPDFATGSSREHAVWALKDYGFKVVLSSKIADIFHGNSSKNGLLAAHMKQEDIENIWDYLADTNSPSKEMTVDLEERRVYIGDFDYPIDVDEYARYRLLNGLDDIDITLQSLDEIKKYESSRPSFKPKSIPVLTKPALRIESAQYDTKSPLAI